MTSRTSAPAQDEIDETVLLTASATAPQAAREALAESLQGHALEQQTLDESVLVVSELVSNAVRHAEALPGDQVRVHWTLRRGIVEVDVTDGGSESVPHPRRPGAWAPTGRGLRLVRSYAHEWGVVDGPRTRTVWASLGGPSRRRTR